MSTRSVCFISIWKLIGTGMRFQAYTPLLWTKADSCLVSTSICICQNPLDRSNVLNMWPFASPTASNTSSSRGRGTQIGHVFIEFAIINCKSQFFILLGYHDNGRIPHIIWLFTYDFVNISSTCLSNSSFTFGGCLYDLIVLVGQWQFLYGGGIDLCVPTRDRSFANTSLFCWRNVANVFCCEHSDAERSNVRGDLPSSCSANVAHCTPGSDVTIISFKTLINTS
jgi:hypothetical protein